MQTHPDVPFKWSELDAFYNFKCSQLFLCKKKEKRKKKLDPYLLPTHARSSVTQVFNVPVAKVQKYTTI